MTAPKGDVPAGDGPLWMTARLEPMNRDGSPIRDHDRDLSTPELREAHLTCLDHSPGNFGVICDDCGCCWCCNDDCCLSREYPCLNENCGCRAAYLEVQRANQGAKP